MHLLLRFGLAAALVASALAPPAAAQTAPREPAAHRLLFTPTARAIPGGAWSVGLTELVVPTAGVGLGAGVSLGAGVLASPQSGFFGTVFVEPKVTVVRRPGLDIAVGATGLVDPFEDGGADGSVAPFAVATVESGRRPGSLAATVGVGARVNVARPFDPSPHYYYRATPAEEGRVGPEPRTDYRVDLVPAPVAFAGLELRASERVTILLEAAALPDRQIAYDVVCGFCYEPRVDLPERGELATSAVYYDASFGTAARFAVGRAQLDVGVIFGRNAESGTRSPPPEVAPWVSVVLGL